MILVTGASGFIGRYVIDALPTSEKIYCLCRTLPVEASFFPKRVSVIQGDLLQREKLIGVFPDGVDTVIHAAGVINAKNDSELELGNVVATQNLVDCCKINKVAHFILLSSSLVESAVAGPYRDTKAKGEEIVTGSGLNYTIIRPSLVYGTGDKRNLSTIVKLIKAFPVVPLVGSGSRLLQPVHVTDVARAVVALASGGSRERKTFVVAGSEAISMQEIFICLMDKIAKSRPILTIPLQVVRPFIPFFKPFLSGLGITAEQLLRSAEDKVYDIQPVIDELGFSPMSFKEGLEKTRF